MNTSLQKRLEAIGSQDAKALAEKDKSYGSSWKKRGGVGAFMMLARKWDRLETQTQGHGYDIFLAIEKNGAHTSLSDEGLLSDVQDLRRYLMLVEDELQQRAAARQMSRAALANLSTPTAPRQTAGQEHPFGFDPSQDLPNSATVHQTTTVDGAKAGMIVRQTGGTYWSDVHQSWGTLAEDGSFQVVPE
jgi:hypothetical protein